MAASSRKGRLGPTHSSTGPGRGTARKSARLLLALAALAGARVEPAMANYHPPRSGLATAVAGHFGITADEGIRFTCTPSRLENIEADMPAYLAFLDIDPDMVAKKVDRVAGRVVYTLDTRKGDSDTLDFKDRPELRLRDSILLLPGKGGRERIVRTVSKKEILLALLQRGRLTEFKDDACDIDALREHIGIRQNTVAWAESLEWRWPNGGRAKWNAKYWHRGTPDPRHSLRTAVNDLFAHPAKYSIGCYTAAKIVMIQGVLDYYYRVRKSPARLQVVESRLSYGREPLVDIEPGKMWHFEAGFDPKETDRPGKLLKIQYGAAARNFVPGDWVYFVNNDPVSSRKTGYEGSNAIYLGRNKFVDFYNDNHHAYTYQEKLDEVYQWRNGVFSRRRDAARIRPLSPQDLERLAKPPVAGGILSDLRVFHYFFGHEELPAPVASRP